MGWSPSSILSSAFCVLSSMKNLMHRGCQPSALSFQPEGEDQVPPADGRRLIAESMVSQVF
jgi:hypothetical protein